MAQKILLGGLGAILVVAVVVGVVATVTRSGNKAGSDFTIPQEAEMATSGKSVKSLCAPTLYKESCEKTLSSANGGTEKPQEVFSTVANGALTSINSARAKLEGGEGRQMAESIGDSMTAGAREDCKELLGDSIDDLKGMVEMAGGDLKVLLSRSDDLEHWITGVMTFLDTCVDGFTDEKLKAEMQGVLRNATELSSNALAITTSLGALFKKLDLGGMFKSDQRRRLLSEADEQRFPAWMRSPERKLLASGSMPAPNAVVAKDGSGKFKTVQDAVNSYPKDHKGRYVIYVKEGVYDEIVMITKEKINIFMYGDGPKKTRVTGSKSFADGITTMKTATFSIEAAGFLCKNMGFHNTAGAEKHQAVALRVQGDMSAFFNCRFDAFQDTLYVHARRQYFRNCVISGTVDFIFGNSAAVFQNCLIITRRPMDNQQNMVTAHGRTDPNMKSGIIIQNCRIVPDQKLFPDRFKIPSYLGRPWKEYSRAVFMESMIADFIKPEGYMAWNGDFGLKTLYFAEYNNRGPGAGTSKRVSWPGFRVIGKKEAEQFTAGPFIDGGTWLKYTGIPNYLGFKN